MMIHNIFLNNNRFANILIQKNRHHVSAREVNVFFRIYLFTVKKTYKSLSMTKSNEMHTLNV